MRGEGDLYDLVEDNIGEPLRLYIYNSDMDNVREVVIVPNEAWGGEGLLGCDNAMSPSKSEGDDERDFPPLTPLRFGRGERPDAEDEAESEDEFVSGGRRGNNSHGLGVSTH
ncbi:hypothetical protein BG004_001151 [Podila humilis]|nr:hypothetical protein BG004_001151 [Podila humilis]